MTNLLESVKCFITGMRYGNIQVSVDSVLGDRNQNMRIGRTYNRGYCVDTFIKYITLHVEDKGEVCTITPLNHTEDSGVWKVTPSDESVKAFEVARGGTTKSTGDDDARIDLGPDFDKLVKSALNGLELGFDFGTSGGGGGKLSDANEARAKLMLDNGLSAAEVADILSVRVSTIQGLNHTPKAAE